MQGAMADMRHRALKHTALTLQPFADAASKRYGMVVSILMAGPTSASNGSIEVRR